MLGTRVGKNSRNERLPVYRPWGGFYYSAPAQVVREMIRNGVARGVGPKNRLDGCVLYDGPVRWAAGTTYVHNREVADTWTDPDGVVHRRNAMDANVRGVYTLKRLSHLDPEDFRKVERSCVRDQPNKG